MIRAATLVAAGLALVGQAGPAAANGFTINACQADRAGFSTQAFEDFATRGMLWKRACDPIGPGLRGLVTANVVRAGRVARGARSYFVLRAPDGTRFMSLNWSGQARRRDCRYALQLWADRPDGPPVAVKNVRANRDCPRPGRAQAAGWEPARNYNIEGTTRIVQRVVCVGAPGQPYCSARGLNYIRTFTAQATVMDLSPPAVTILQDNPFTRGEWVSGVQSVGYDAADNAGVKLGRAIVAGRSAGEHSRPCNYSQRIPCSNGTGSITVDTGSLAEGSQPLAVYAEDAAANPAESGPITVRVDNTAPGAVPVMVEGGESWRNANGFNAVWHNPDEGDRAPITAAHYRLCRAAGGDCTTGSRFAGGIDRLADLAMPGPGEWQLSLWREDAATNQEPTNASVPVTMRYDPEPPQLGFEAPSASDPTRVSVLVTDKVSGLAGGQIELSRQGSGSWQTLPTQQEDNRLVSRIDDAQLPPGAYELRATARDHASNQNSTDRRLDGQPMTITLPLRISTVLRAGVMSKRTVRRAVTRRGKRRMVRRRITVLAPEARVAFGRQVTVVGTVENQDGQPIPGAEVQVFSRSATTPEQLVGVAHTDSQGRYSYIARASSTRTLRFVYPGTLQTLPANGEVLLLVPAASTIHARPRRLRNGQAVRFAGRLRSQPVPPGGKLIELQVVLSGRWQTFRTMRTDPDGAWRVSYRFRRSCGLVRYRFRARLPAEAGYPFEAGRTGGVAVRVRGRPCR